MNLSVENLLPECIKRRFVLRTETFQPNKPVNFISKVKIIIFMFVLILTMKSPKS